jgi:regulator of replication initiation timing
MTISNKSKIESLALLNKINDPREIRTLDKSIRDSIVNRIYEIYPFTKTLNFTEKQMQDALARDIQKSFYEGVFLPTESDLFSKEELDQWAKSNDETKDTILERVENTLFKGESIDIGPCGDGKGLFFGNELMQAYRKAIEVIFQYTSCSPEKGCFDSLTPLQEICKLYREAEKDREGIEQQLTDYPFGSVAYKKLKESLEERVREKLLVVESRLKSEKLTDTDKNALAEKYGHGSYSVSQLALGINKYAYGFGEDKRLYHFVTVCNFYLP